MDRFEEARKKLGKDMLLDSLASCGIKDSNPNIEVVSVEGDEYSRVVDTHNYEDALPLSHQGEVKLIARCLLRHRARQLKS